MRRTTSRPMIDCSRVRRLLISTFLVTILVGLMIPAVLATINQDKWGGYEFYNSAGSSYNLWEVYGHFTVPTISIPPTDCPHWGGHCHIAFWIGLSNGAGGQPGSGGYPGLAQGGVAADIFCPAWYCNLPTYSAWYEFLNPDTSATTCINNVNPGDVMSVMVESAGWWGGNPSLYYIEVHDITSGAYCNPSKTMPMGAPFYADFIVEHIDGMALPYFGSVTFNTAALTYPGGTVYSILVPYNAHTYYAFDIYNAGNQNTFDPSAVTNDQSGYGAYTETWKTSLGS